MNEANRSIGQNRDTVIYTSRDLVTGATAEESIRIQADVAGALIEIVRGIQAAPRYVLAKGGITSHDIAAKALGVQRAIVMGQIVPGRSRLAPGRGLAISGDELYRLPGKRGGRNRDDRCRPGPQGRIITNLQAPFLPGCLSRHLLFYIVQ